MDIEKVNSMDLGEFVDVFGNVTERCPLIAAAVWSQRPLSDLEDLEKHFLPLLMPFHSQVRLPYQTFSAKGFQICLSKYF